MTDASRRVEELLGELEPAVFTWVNRKGYAKRLWAQVQKYNKQWERLEEAGVDEAADRIMAQLAMIWVFADEKRSRAFWKTARSQGELSDAAMDFLKTAVEEPWYMTAFELLAEEGEQLIRFVDYDDDRQYIVHSPGLRQMFSQGRRVCYALLFYNGECFQTYGPLYYLEWAQPMDLQYFAERVDPQLYRREGLMEVMTANPLPWAALYPYARYPRMHHRQHVMEVCDAEVPLRHLPEEKLPPQAEIRRHGHVLRAALDPEDSFYGPRVIWDGKKGRLLVQAMTAAGYEQGRELLRPIAELPEHPQSRCSGTMYIVAYDVLGPDTFDHYSRYFEEGEPLKELLPEEGAEGPDSGAGGLSTAGRAAGGTGGTGRAAAGTGRTTAGAGEEAGGSLENLNQAISMITEAYNEGLEINPERIAAETGLDAEQVRSLKEQIAATVSRNSPPGGEPDFMGLSPSQVHELMRHPLEECSSLVKVQADQARSEDMAAAPWPGIAWALLEELGREGTLKTTGKGNLPLKTVGPLYELELRLWEEFGRPFSRVFSERSPRSEEEALGVHAMRLMLKESGYIETTARSMRLSQAGRDVLEAGDIRPLYRALLRTARRRINLAYFTGLDDVSVLQSFFPFLLFVFSRYGDEPLAIEKLAGHFTTAFPRIYDELPEDRYGDSKERHLMSSLDIVFCGRFAEPFGLLKRDTASEESSRSFIPSAERRYRPTRLFRELLAWHR